MSALAQRFIAPVAVALLAAAVLPAEASAHAGVTAPAATSYLARIATVPRGIAAKVVDGDQRLWLRVPASMTVTVIGLRGERYLRFSSRGIEVNTNSATYYLNRVRPAAIPKGIGLDTPPAWRRISSAHSTSWHEDRLHALALAAHPSGARSLGRWTVPLIVNGTRMRVNGTLSQAPRPTLLWFWPLLLLLVSVPALLRLRDAGWDGAAGWALAALALSTATLGRLGRELYGRPSVSDGQLALVAMTCAVALGLAALWLRREWRVVAGFLIGVVALYQGLVLVGTLRNAYVLAVVPAWTERTATVLSIAAGAALALVTLVGGHEANEKERAAELETAAGP